MVATALAGQEGSPLLVVVPTLEEAGRWLVGGAPGEAPALAGLAGELAGAREGQRAQVVQPFVNGRGRVFVSGAEWIAEIDGVGRTFHHSREVFSFNLMPGLAC